MHEPPNKTTYWPPVTPGGPSVVTGECAGESAGDFIGPYRLMEQIGEGGFGTVWLAERREPMVQRVALKVIKVGMDTRAFVARFEQERQALALMDHPNVARVLDGGVTPAPMGSRPFFVMEYVKGEPITQYCDRHRFTLRQRLELFIPVCEAVQHAHTKGIIHRDLKPSNILVAAPDVSSGSSSRVAPPVPKVIDFGIAKAVSQTLTDKTIVTERGQLIGTLEYMSPEQAEGGSSGVDTRADVYALGVVLYELLTGMLPFDSRTLRSRSYFEIQRIIREVDPPRPSAILSALSGRPPSAESDPDRAPSLEQIAHRRSTAAERLTAELRRELEWVPLKAMRKDRNERYRSPAELGDDIRNYLAGRALVAGPQSAPYRLRKFVTRHRAAVVAAGALLLTLVLGVIGTSLGFVAAARRAEGEKAAKVEAVKAKGEAETKRELAEAKTVEAENARRQAEYGAYVANLIGADASLSANEPSLARAGLDACPEHLRGWEWRWLNARADTSLWTMRGHEGWVRGAAFSPDGATIATASVDRTVRLWDVATRATVRTLTGHEDWIGTVHFSRDGAHLVTASADRTARVWDTASGRELAVLRGHDGLVHSAAFDASGERVVTSSFDRTARVWDWRAGRVVAVLTGHGAEVREAEFSPSGDRVVTASEDSTARIWDASTGAESGVLRHDSWVMAARFSPAGDRVVTSGGDNTARIWDASSLAQLAMLRGHQDEVWSAAFSPSGDRVVTSSSDKTVRLWDATSGEERRVLRGHESWIPSALFDPSGDFVVSASADGTARLWDTRTDAAPVLRGHTGWVFWCQFSPAGDRIATASHDNTARLWDTSSGSPLAVLRGHDKLVRTACFAPSGDRLVTASEDSTVRVWNTTSGEQVAMLPGPAAEAWSACFSPSGDRIVGAFADGTAVVWDSQSAVEVASLRGHAGGLRWACFDHSGDRIVTASRDNTARIWDARSGEALTVLRGHTRALYSAAFSPDGARIVTAAEDNTARLWDAASGRELAVLRGHESWLHTASFSPDGARVLTASADATARIWDAATGRQLAVLRGHKNWVFCAGFSASGDRVVTGSRDGTARVWDSVPYRDRYPAAHSPQHP